MAERRDKAPPPSGEGAATVRGDSDTAQGASRNALDPALIIDGRYRIESELGRGGMAVGYLARDAWLDRQVALKVIANSWASDPRAAKSFQSEAKQLAAIRNQNVVQVYTFGPHAGSYF